MDKKVLVLDLDGTLTNANKEITPDTKEAIMKIQKIFGNIENETEKLYSVLMSEGEYNLFSEHKKDQEDNFRKNYNEN